MIVRQESESFYSRLYKSNMMMIKNYRLVRYCYYINKIIPHQPAMHVALLLIYCPRRPIKYSTWSVTSHMMSIPSTTRMDNDQLLWCWLAAPIIPSNIVVEFLSIYPEYSLLYKGLKLH